MILTREFKLIDGNDRKLQARKMRENLTSYNMDNYIEPSFPKTARYRSLFNAYYITECFKEQTKVAYVGEVFPNELLFAFGFISLNFESISTLFSQSEAIDMCLRLTEENYLPRDLCSSVRAAYGAALANCLPRPDMIIINNHLCDGLSKLGFQFSKIYDTVYSTFNVPLQETDESVAYLAEQFQHVLQEIEQATGMAYDDARFRQVIALSNEAKDYFLKTIDIAKKVHIPGLQRELYEIMAVNCWGMKEMVKICRTLYDETQEKLAAGETAPRMKRMLWVGLAPDQSHEMVQYLEHKIELVYWTTYWEGNLMLLDSGQTLETMARRSISYLWNSVRMREQTAYVCDENEIDCIILVNTWGCRNMMGLGQAVREMALLKKIKFLSVDVDIRDKNNYSFSQVKNRIDAFLEIL
ncbi:2-hydroxyacyl-CoA dehydratase subunit D [Paenibacillus tepidiphilus]|uniref:2-hydroxyacyl-CoA dehydratase subunit D n=1 Tax=Paenibacillus tepidiphilus TaxID=2608683 RepID=UPI0012386AED|nr:2-hydroxyacyl-CoA dehydratase family protein [Paenibacillus tepidiphilus]